MKSGDKLTAWIIILFCTCLCMSAGTSPVEASEQFGAILIAHGASNPEWNQEILALHKKVANAAPCELELALIGYTNDNTLDEAIKKLLKRKSGITELLLVHIAPSSYSYNEQIKKFAEDVVRNNKKPPQFEIVAMDDHPLAAEILSQYARALSKKAGEESLILVGSGPIEELENISSLMDLEHMGEKIQNELGFKEVVCINLRNHSPDVIFIRAINDLQRAAKRLKTQGRVIVVPYVLQKNFYVELESYLKGIIPSDHIYKQEILSHPNMEKWVSQVIAQGIKQTQPKEVNRQLEKRFYEVLFQETDQTQRKAVNRNWSVMKQKSMHNYGFTGK